ncbi:GYD domain protein [bacterium BMS3Abin05]|nr:GYD domain protein [bacterium BMS3Abin05]GBE26671.1 GYD domain protein [bacterium BMS3Bbin03]
MSIFIMFGKYSPEAIQKISKERTLKVLEIVKKQGGEVKSMYALMGAYDLIMVANFETMKEALRASVAITRATGISFSTLPAMPVEEFDALVDKN